MPNIRELDAPSGLGLNPTETGIEATAGAARRGGAFYNQAAEAQSDTGRRISSTIQDVGDIAVKYEDHREISAGAATGTELIANATKQWNEIAKNADPNDSTVAQKFMTETLQPALDKWTSSFNTENSQKWAQQFADQYRKHMFESTTSTMMGLAGQAVQQNARTTVNSLSSAVANDPTSLDFALKTIDHTLGGMADSANLDAETSAKVKGAIIQDAKESTVKAAISSMITKNPNVDLDAIQQKYGAFIKGDEMRIFQKAAQTQAKVDQLQQKQLETYTRQTNERKAEKASNDSLTKNVSIDPQTSRAVVKPEFFSDALEIAKMPDAPQGLARTLIDWGQSQLTKEGKIVDDPVAKRDLTDRLFDPDHPTTRIDLMKAQTAGKISDHTFQSMERLVTELETSPLKGDIWKDTANAVKGELILTNVGLPGKDITGEGNYAKWAQTFIPQYLAKSRDGSLPPNALDVKDPNSMISQSMAPFKRTVQQRANDYLSTLGGAGPSNQSTRMVGDVPVPKALGGIADLQFNKSTMQWRDRASGKVYDRTGAPQ